MICHKCDRQVNGKKKFNWLIFLLYYFIKRPKCELCGCKL